MTGLTITNCTFYNNDASSEGGAIHFDSDTATDVDSTADNCIFWGNTADTADTNEISFGDNVLSEMTFSYCDIADSNGSGPGWEIKGVRYLFLKPNFINNFLSIVL
ncbi:hypothetical protein ACFL3G_13160 [Planctomycetota bacterium]